MLKSIVKIIKMIYNVKKVTLKWYTMLKSIIYILL